MDPDPACHFDAEACHLQIDADPDPGYHFDADPDPGYHFDAGPDPSFQFDVDPDPDSQHCSPLTPFIPEFSLYKKRASGAENKKGISETVTKIRISLKILDRIQ